MVIASGSGIFKICIIAFTQESYGLVSTENKKKLCPVSAVLPGNLNLPQSHHVHQAVKM